MRSLPAAMTFFWLNDTPLGGPVDPEVYMMQQRSSGSGGDGSTTFSSPSFLNSSKLRMFRSGNSDLNWSRSDCFASVSVL